MALFSCLIGSHVPYMRTKNIEYQPACLSRSKRESTTPAATVTLFAFFTVMDMDAPSARAYLEAIVQDWLEKLNEIPDLIGVKVS